MQRIRKELWLLIILISVMIPITSPQAQQLTANQEEEGVFLVGRIAYIEGELLRYVPDEEDWVATAKDAPFGLNDTLYSDRDARAEIIMPNNTWMRMDSDTQIQLIAIKDDVTEIDVASGTVRFYNKSSDVTIKARTPFGYIMGPAATSFDLYIGDESVEVIALEGTVFYVHEAGKKKFEVIAGSSSIIADSRQVTAGEADTDPYWDAWNMDRDALWVKRMKIKGKSARYLPPSLHHHAYVLEGHGRWERVYYDGAYQYFWRPVYVNVGWAPFTAGRWTVWYGDHTWIPCEPFGYVTHHYGNWVFVNGFWCWAPPVAYVRVHLGPPRFAWYPGRVAWIHFGVHIGWVPLAPHEPYYCYRRWGRRAVVVKNINIINVNLKINKYRYIKHAVVIDRNNLYKVNNYRNVRIRNINNRTIIRKYHVAPVINNRAIRNYKNTKRKYNFTNVNVTRNPHRTVVNKIQRNHFVAKPRANVTTKKVQQKVANFSQDRLIKGDRVNRSIVKNRSISANQANKQVLQIKRKRREPERKGRLWPANQRQANKELEEVRKKRRLPKPDQQLLRGRQVYQERQGSRKAWEDRQIQEPVQGKKRHNAERGKSIAGSIWKPYFPSPDGIASPKSRFRFDRKGR